MPTGQVIISDSLVKARLDGVMLPAPGPWIHPNPIYKDKIILSPNNSKVNQGSLKLNLGYALAYGKPAILSCAFNGDCIKYCYGRKVNARYKASLRIHGHNYTIIYGKRLKPVLNAIQTGYNLACELYPRKDFNVIRLNDNGDFISYAEVKAWILFADNNPSLIVYGYTKASPYIWKALNEFKRFPDNFRITLSITDNLESSKYTQRCISEFRSEVITCKIIDKIPDPYPALPWNNLEEQAIKHTSDFKIALHNNSNISKFYKDLSDKIGIQTC